MVFSFQNSHFDKSAISLLLIKIRCMLVFFSLLFYLFIVSMIEHLCVCFAQGCIGTRKNLEENDNSLTLQKYSTMLKF